MGRDGVFGQLPVTRGSAPVDRRRDRLGPAAAGRRTRQNGSRRRTAGRRTRRTFRLHRLRPDLHHRGPQRRLVLLRRQRQALAGPAGAGRRSGDGRQHVRGPHGAARQREKHPCLEGYSRLREIERLVRSGPRTIRFRRGLRESQGRLAPEQHGPPVERTAIRCPHPSDARPGPAFFRAAEAESGRS